MTSDDRERMRDFYDALGEDEWLRLEESPRTRVALEVHKQFLSHFVKPGDHALEVGAGPGRFTFELARLGATIEVTDYSPVQLELHQQHVFGTSAESAVTSRTLLDICDTSRYPDANFDVVLAYGGPLSYAFEQTDEAFAGLLRITKPGGYIVCSVMSLLGTWRYFLNGVVADTKIAGEDANDLVLTTGDLRHFGTSHICQMFRTSDIEKLISRTGGELIALSASNWASLADRSLLEELESDAVKWSNFIRHEVSACSEPGVVDGGTHILFAVRKL